MVSVALNVCAYTILGIQKLLNKFKYKLTSGEIVPNQHNNNSDNNHYNNNVKNDNMLTASLTLTGVLLLILLPMPTILAYFNVLEFKATMRAFASVMAHIVPSVIIPLVYYIRKPRVRKCILELWFDA